MVCVVVDTMKLGNKFVIVLWKNFLLKRRAWLLTLIEVRATDMHAGYPAPDQTCTDNLHVWHTSRVRQYKSMTYYMLGL